MKAKHWKTLATVIAYGAIATTGFADGGFVTFENPDQSNIEKLALLETVKKIGMGALAYVIGPLTGSFTVFKGWQMIGNSPRGEKGPGVLVFICGIGMFALPKIIQEVVAAIQGT